MIQARSKAVLDSKNLSIQFLHAYSKQCRFKLNKSGIGYRQKLIQITVEGVDSKKMPIKLGEILFDMAPYVHQQVEVCCNPIFDKNNNKKAQIVEGLKLSFDVVIGEVDNSQDKDLS